MTTERATEQATVAPQATETPPATVPQAQEIDEFVVVNLREGTAPSAPSAPSAPTAPPAAHADPEAEETLVTVTAVPEFATMHLDTCRLMTMIDVTAPPILESQDISTRAPVEICAVIDRSGSMRVKKLALVLASLEFIVRELTDADRLSVITYDQTVKRVLPLTSMTKANKREAVKLLKAIKPGGSTNLSGGLLEGLKEMTRGVPAASAPRKPTAQAVWLFTDGMANVGIKELDPLVEAVHNVLPEESKVSISTFGFGDTHNDEMLRAVAEAGSGMYYFLQKPEDIPNCFAECLGGLLTVVASNLVITFEATDGVKVVAAPEATDVVLEPFRLKVKDMYGDETRNILVELELQGRDTQNTQVLGCVAVSYTDTAGKVHTVEAPLSVDRVVEYAAEREADVEVAAHAYRIEATREMKRAKVEADAGRYKEAEGIMKNMKAKVSSHNRCSAMRRVAFDDEEECDDVSAKRRCKAKKKSKSMSEHLEADMDMLGEQLNADKWAKAGRKAFTSTEMMHKEQRSVCSSMAPEAAACSYATPAQAKMKSKMAKLFK